MRIPTRSEAAVIVLFHELGSLIPGLPSGFNGQDRAFYVSLRASGIERNDALRRLANRLVGILRPSHADYALVRCLGQDGWRAS